MSDMVAVFEVGIITCDRCKLDLTSFGARSPEKTFEMAMDSSMNLGGSFAQACMGENFMGNHIFKTFQ